jgi:hypothetical protein
MNPVILNKPYQSYSKIRVFGYPVDVGKHLYFVNEDSESVDIGGYLKFINSVFNNLCLEGKFFKESLSIYLSQDVNSFTLINGDQATIVVQSCKITSVTGCKFKRNLYQDITFSYPIKGTNNFVKDSELAKIKLSNIDFTKKYFTIPCIDGIGVYSYKELLSLKKKIYEKYEKPV